MNDILEEIIKVFNMIDGSEAERIIDLIEKSDKIFVVGRGRSGYMMQGLCMRLVHLGYRAFYIGDVNTPKIGQKDLLIIGSGSGETKSVLCLAEKAKSLGANIALMTLSKKSKIQELSDATFVIPGFSPGNKYNGFESIQPLASLFEECLELCCETLVTTLFVRKELTNDIISNNHTNIE
mgnify:CR=1 FL=1